MKAGSTPMYSQTLRNGCTTRGSVFRKALGASAAAFVLSALAPAAQAQVVWPFDGPFAVHEERNAEGAVYSERVFDVTLDECVSRFRTLVETQTPLAPRIYVAGLGYETARENWTVVIVREGREILPISLSEQSGRCVARFASEAWALRDADLRVALPPLVPFDARPVPVDGPDER